MSRLGFKTTKMLSRHASSLIKASPTVAPTRFSMAAPLCQGARQVSTTRPKKAQATKEAVKGKATAAPKETAAKAKASVAKTRKASTKATAAAKEDPADVKATPAKKAVSAKSKTTASTGAAKKTATKAKVTPEKASTTAVPQPKTNTAPAAPAPTAKAPVAVASTKTTPPPNTASSTRFVPSQQQPASSASSPAASSPLLKPIPEPSAVASPVPPQSSGKSKPTYDESSPEYKEAARKWTSTMIALPILIVTSYFLFDRLALGHNPSLEEIRERIRGETAPNDATASKAE